MSLGGYPARILLLGLASILCACGSPQKPQPDPAYNALIAPSTRQPVDALERAILSKLDELEPGKETAVDGASVTADAAYFAASGRMCRSVMIRGQGPERARLACQLDQAWSFVPDVLGPMAGGRSP